MKATRLFEIMREPGSPTAHLLPLVNLADTTIQSNGFGLTILPTEACVGDMDHWTWQALRIVLVAWTESSQPEE